MKQELINVGAIVNAHGIRGEVKLNPVGFDPEFLAEFDRFNIGGKETEVRSSRVHKSVLLLTLPGVEDMDAALALKGKTVAIYADDVALPEGEYFDVELEGCAVLDDATGEEIGKRLTLPPVEVSELLKRYEVHARKDDGGQYIIGVGLRDDPNDHKGGNA